MKSMKLAVLVVVVTCFGCTKPNPKSCLDGICSDQDFPFCDVDGMFGGEPNECIAVECTAGEHIGCRGDQAIRCNPSGNNYEAVQCERGCDDNTGCFSCTANDDCSNPAPVCDTAAHTCRVCREDDECGSRVCDVDVGTCLAESQVTYAAPGGSDTGPCSLLAPCSIARSIELAFGNPLRSTVRLLPGTYSSVESLVLQRDGTISLVGTGASVKGFFMDRGEATIRGVAFDFDQAQWSSRGLTTANRLHVRDSTFALTQQLVLFNTIVKFSRVDVRWLNGFQGELVINGQTNIEVVNSRLRCLDALCYMRVRSGAGKIVKIIGSVFDDFDVFLETTDAVDSQSRFELAFNTFFSPSHAQAMVDCSGSGNWTALFENNIINSGASSSVIPSSKCTFNRNVVFPQTPFAGSNTFSSPKVANVITRDLQLQSDSPAVDAAVPSSGLDSSVDIIGTPRPQGAAKDIGAYERKP